jgi:hypothetical protein
VIIQYQKMAEKIQINLSNDQKKSSDEQFLQAPRNWQKCSALVGTSFTEMFAVLLSFCQSAITATTPPPRPQQIFIYN